MECKKALVEAKGDIELAIKMMRKSGGRRAAGNVADEGAIIIKEDNGCAVLLEVNCEADVVAKHPNFTAFAEHVALAALQTKASAEMLIVQFEEERRRLVSKIGDINIRRVAYIQGGSLTSYRHGAKIGVVIVGEGDARTLEEVAMHVAATKPKYLNPEDVPVDEVAREREVQIEIAMNEGKPQRIAEKMVIGRMKKFIGQISLTGQAFIMEPKKTVGEILKERGASVSRFVRLEVGEGIARKQSML